MQTIKYKLACLMVQTSETNRKAAGTSACVIRRNPVTFGVCKIKTISLISLSSPQWNR